MQPVDFYAFLEDSDEEVPQSPESPPKKKYCAIM